MPDRDWDFVSLALDVAIDPDRRTISGKAEHVVRPLALTPELTLHAVDLDIAAVRVDGNDVAGWRQVGERLIVPVPVAPGERVVEVAWTARPTAGMYFRGPPADRSTEVWTQGEDQENRFWYPGWDYPNDRFSVSVAVTVPDGLTAVAIGEFQGKEPGQTPGTTRWRYALDTPVVNYLVALAAGEYRVVRDDGSPVLEQLVPTWADERTVARTTDDTRAMLAWFGDTLGAPYPWGVYRQVFVQRFLYGGMENATTSIIADRHLLDRDDLDPRTTDLVLAHEAAHQWFGDWIGIYGWRELWLNEGFATYWSNRWRAHRDGEASVAPEVLGWMENGLRDEAPLAPRSGTARAAQVYARGGAVLHALDVALGREAFDRAIRAYVADNGGGLVETPTLRRALEDASGTHLGWLFDRWVHGTAFPALSAGWSWDDDLLTVSVTGEPSGAPVWIEIAGESGRRRVVLAGERTTLVVPMPAPPAYVAVDPDRGLLARWTFEQPESAWIAQLGSPTPLARLTALCELGRGKSTPAVEAALAAIAREPGEHAATRVAALEALGALGLADPLEAALRDPDPRIRRAAVAALGEAPTRPERAALARGLVGDRSPEVAEAALYALERLDPAAALAEARRLAAGRSARNTLHGPALDVIGRNGGKADLARVLGYLDPRETRETRHAAARAAVELKVEEERVERALWPWLDSADRLDAGLAIGLLGRIGTDASAPPLRAYAAGQALRRPDLAQSARDAIAAIAGRRPGGPKTAEELAELERLRTALEALEERVEELETWR